MKHTMAFAIENACEARARTAVDFVHTAKAFKARIEVRAGSISANAKSLLEIMRQGAEKSEELTVTAKGCDADEALRAISQTSFLFGFRIAGMSSLPGGE